MIRWLGAFVVVLTLSACEGIRKVESGVRPVGQRLTMNIEGNWNQLDFPGLKPAEVWTIEGLFVDELLIYPGIKDGQAMHPKSEGSSRNKDFVFRSSMPTEEIVSMFEGVLTRDGSTFKLLKIEPHVFGGRRGFRYEYERIRKDDGVVQRGLGFGAVDQGELFALVYHAPRLTFFPRHRGRVEAIANSVSIR